MHNLISHPAATAQMHWLHGLDYCLQALSNQDRDLASRLDQAIGGCFLPHRSVSLEEQLRQQGEPLGCLEWPAE